MASSLININSASLEELQAIDGIGAQLALRIIDFRSKSGGIVVKEQLVAVRGLGRKQIDQMALSIDWSTSGPNISRESVSRIPALVMSVAVISILLLLIYPMVELLLEEFTHWEDNILHWFTLAANLLAILFTASTLILMLGWLLSIFYARSSAPAKITRYGSGATVTFLLLMVVVSLAGYWNLNTYTDVTAYMLNLTVIIGSVLLLVYLQYGPQLLCLTRYHLSGPASWLFDYSLFPIAIAILLTAFLESSMSLVVDVFIIWVGVLLITYGLTLSRSCSCYADLLRDIYTWPNILPNNPAMAVKLSNTIQNIDKVRSQQLTFMVIGWATIAVSATVVIHGLYELAKLVLLQTE